MSLSARLLIWKVMGNAHFRAGGLYDPECCCAGAHSAGTEPLLCSQAHSMPSEGCCAHRTSGGFKAIAMNLGPGDWRPASILPTALGADVGKRRASVPPSSR